jgi:hypothetical protein
VVFRVGRSDTVLGALVRVYIAVEKPHRQHTLRGIRRGLEYYSISKKIQDMEKEKQPYITNNRYTIDEELEEHTGMRHPIRGSPILQPE